MPPKKKNGDRPRLQVVGEKGAAMEYPLQGQAIFIGRTDDNDIVLDDSSVSRRHAKITKDGEAYSLADLGSHNGTALNGILTQSAPLRDGDQIKIGGYRLTFYLGESRDPTSAVTVTQIQKKDWAGTLREVITSRPSGQCAGESSEWLSPSQSKRNQKVLFVLYEISRQLNAIADFHQLLEKIMDLLLLVIDADYGFLILSASRTEADLIPVVVKFKNSASRPSAEIQASRSLIHKVIQDKVALLVSDAMSDSRWVRSESLIQKKIRSALCVPLWKKDQIIGVIQLESLRPDSQFTVDDLELLNAVGCQMALVIEQMSLQEKIREEERLKNRLARFLSPQVTEMILKGGEESKKYLMDPHLLEASILFIDIVGFTALSEKMQTEEINMFLNQFFTRMTEIIFRHNGMLDKYIGDGLMAVFGAPVQTPDHAERALRTALEVRQELSRMMDKSAPEQRFDIRIGVNSGQVLAGNIGSPQRMDYTVIGDAVNIAARLESMARPNQILIGEETYLRAKDKFRMEKIGLRKIRGRHDEVTVYDVIEESLKSRKKGDS
jgi:adenylate cyclase